MPVSHSPSDTRLQHPGETSAPVVSIVAPIFNEEETLPELCRRVTQVMQTLGIPYELILVNDGSSDDSLALMQSLHQSDPRTKYVSLSRNFGHQIAITAGLDFATGAAVVVMDGDLQDPPELLPALIDKWRAGFVVVYAVRQERAGLSYPRQSLYRAFYRLLRALARIDIPVDSGDFRLMSRRVIDTLKQMPERNRFVRGLTAWVGFQQTGVPYDRPDRYAGTVKYSVAKLWRLGMDGLISFSYLPLQLATWLGFLIAGSCTVFIGYLFWARLFADRLPDGWTSLMVAVVFLGGIQLLTLGIVGEYIGRIFDEVKGRPVYIVDHTGGLTTDPKGHPPLPSG